MVLDQEILWVLFQIYCQRHLLLLSVVIELFVVSMFHHQLLANLSRNHKEGFRLRSFVRLNGNH